MDFWSVFWVSADFILSLLFLITTMRFSDAIEDVFSGIKGSIASMLLWYFWTFASCFFMANFIIKLVGLLK